MMVGTLEGRFLEMLVFAIGAAPGARDRDVHRVLVDRHGRRLRARGADHDVRARARPRRRRSPAHRRQPLRGPDRGHRGPGPRHRGRAAGAVRLRVHRRRQGRVRSPTSRRCCPSSRPVASSPSTTPCGAGRWSTTATRATTRGRHPGLQRRAWWPTRGWCASSSPCATASPSSAVPTTPAGPGPADPTAPRARLPPPPLAPRPARQRPHARAGRRLLRARRGGGRHRDRAHRAPLPLPPGRRACCAASGTTSPTPPCGRRWRSTGTTMPAPTSTRTCRACSRPRPPAFPSCSASRSTTTGVAWTTWRHLLAGYPFDVLLGSVHWIGAWRFDDVDDPVSMAQWSAARRRRGMERLRHGAIEELAATGTCDVLAHPDLVKVAGHRPARARGVSGTDSSRRRARRAWRPRSRRRGGASPWPRPIPPRRC